MNRIYEVVETQWGFDIVGPNNHRWVCSGTENRSRVTAMAKALDRAYVEGTAEITSNQELIRLLTSLSLIEERPDPEKMAGFRKKATEIMRHVEKLRAIASKTKKTKKAESESGPGEGEGPSTE